MTRFLAQYHPVMLGACLAAAAATGCRENPPTAPVPLNGSLAKAAGAGGAGPKVSSTSPDSGARNTTLFVRVLGSGYGQGTRAIWAIKGDTTFAVTKVKTNSTTFVSSSELLANITISGDASLSLYDVVVVTASDKKGIGIELFTVTLPPITATALPSLGGVSTARAINDDQVIVGTSNGLPVKWTFASGQWTVSALQGTSGQAEDITEAGVIVGSSGGSVILWSPGVAPETIGIGWPMAINESQVVVGTDYSVAGANPARAWTRSGTTWVAHLLPRLAGVTDGPNEPRDIGDDGTIVGAAGSMAGGGTRPVKWVPNPTTGEWDAAVYLDDVAATHLGGALAIVGQDIVGEILRCVNCSTGHDPYHWSLTSGQGIGSLGTEVAYAEGLNAERWAVGTWLYSGSRAFVWTPGNPTIRNLGNVNGYQTAHAYDINSPKYPRTRSQAVGEASASNGNRIAVLWSVP
jgi:hypothetical protein